MVDTASRIPLACVNALPWKRYLLHRVECIGKVRRQLCSQPLKHAYSEREKDGNGYDPSWITNGPTCASPFYKLTDAPPTLFNLILATMLDITEDIILSCDEDMACNHQVSYTGPLTDGITVDQLTYDALCQKLRVLSSL